MKKIISFSLWGTNPKYTNGAIENAKLSPDIYPNWICRFYIGKSTPNFIVDKLKTFPHVEIIVMDEDGDWNGMFWRFYPISDEDVEIMISRDCDSRLSLREKLCVDEFINSDKMFHMIIDHPFHGGIMGGMWGAKKGILSNMKELINNFEKTNQWQTDQNFLNRVVLPIIINNSLTHDSINLKNFPSKRINFEFVGEIFDHNNDRGNHYTIFINDNQYKNL